MADTAAKKDDGMIKPVDGADSLNTLIKKMNQCTKEWNDIDGPVQKFKTATLKAAGLEKTPGSNIVHVMLGLILTFIADLNMTFDEVKK